MNSKSRNLKKKAGSLKAVVAKTLVILPMVYCSPGHAVLSVTPNPMDNIDIMSWAGATSDLIGTSNFCILSYQGSDPTTPLQYELAAYQINPGGTPGFVLEHTVTSDRMNVTMVFNATNGSSYTLSNYDITGYFTPLIPGTGNCTAGAASLDVTVPAAEIASAQAGIYTGTLGIDLLQYLPSGSTSAYSGILQFQVTVPELAQINRLNDAILTRATAQDDFTVTEPFCIFRNGQGGFSLTFNGTNDSGGSFNLLDLTTVPYTVEVGQSGSWQTVTPGVTINAATSGFTGDAVRDCAGADNTDLRLTLFAIDANTKAPGNYVDTLTIMVAPN